jgi:serine/threonine protein phosphatase PrpC
MGLKQPSFALDNKLILTEQDMERLQHYHLAGMDVVIYSRRSPDKLSANEDALALIPIQDDSFVALVADGVGGQRGGTQASQTVVDGLGKSLKDCSAENLRNAILDGIELANHQIQALGLGAASTLALLEVNRNLVRPYHIGDSEILIVGQKGKIKLHTLSHSPSSYAVEAGIIESHEAMLHEERHLVSNLLGYEDMRIELGAQIKLNRYDTALVASDGLFDNLSIQEIADITRKGPLPIAMQNLVALSLERMHHEGDADTPNKPDDISIILVRQHGK